MAVYYLIENHKDVENTIVTGVREYFNDQIKIKEIFPKFGKVRVSETHPFAIINTAIINGQKEPSNLFPSVSFSVVDEPVGAQLLNLESNIVQVDQEWLDEQDDNELINQNQLATLKTALTASPNDFLLAVQTTDRVQSSGVYAIWSENRIIRSFLYDHVRAFILTHRATFLELDFENWTLSGTPAGLYNIEHGRILYGAELTQVGQRQITYVTIDTTWDTVKEVDHYIDDITPTT